MLRAIVDMNKEIEEMTDEELGAIIAEGKNLESDPEAEAMLAKLFMPEFQARRKRLPAGVRWSAPTPEGAEQVLRDTIDKNEDVEQRRQERIAMADAVLTRMGV